MDLASISHAVSVWLLPVVIAITLHEAAHGWMAERCGDNTARLLGRVSFNPLKHVDPFGTLILPGILLLLKAPFLFGSPLILANPFDLGQPRENRAG
jgi:Zn-dependent protease